MVGELKLEEVIIVVGNIVKVVVDRPLGSYHPKHKDMYYPINLHGQVQNPLIGI